MKTTAIILAAGKGSRMHSKIEKQFMELGGYPVIYYALKAFEESPVDSLILVTGKNSVEYCRHEIIEKYHFTKVVSVVEGGENRYDSVYNGLRACSETDYVMIHDGARPFVTQDMIVRSIRTLAEYKACTVGMPVKDTIKIVDTDHYGVETPERKFVYQIQTPQTFQVPLLRRAYETMYEAKRNGDTHNITDDTMLVEQYAGVRCKVVEGAYENIKITTPEDLAIAEIFVEKTLKKI
jgi:2-C-methyl-D-erythritol 4-phosphate cytidylyltransferase